MPNYRRRENKDLFNRIFLRTAELEKLCERHVFFLVGEKGTGKTAYAVYLSNSPYKAHISTHRYVRQTDYQKFMSLKRARQLTLSDYTDIWKVTLYLLLSGAIYEHTATTDFLLHYLKFKALKDAIDEYYNHAFSPEIPIALQFVENSQRTAELVAKYYPVEAKLELGSRTTTNITEHQFQTDLLFLQKRFEDALSSLKLRDSHIFFIDGIDIRPNNIPYKEYLECVQGLTAAVWSVNNDFFPTIRDSSGRLRVVLLVRPDIFNSLGLQNRNTKLKDNAVVLDWRTTYADHRRSPLFLMADRLFSAQQLTSLPPGTAWDHYFPFDAATVYSDQSRFSSFIVFLRYSFYRPRDILTIFDILKNIYNTEDNPDRAFRYRDLFASEFRRRYGDYLLGEVRDSLSFYYDEKQFEAFLQFFGYLNGKNKFTYDEYTTAYAEFVQFLTNQGMVRPEFMRSEEEFLQFIYDLNIICFFEQTEVVGAAFGEPAPERFIRWCFLERSPSNISPKVRTGMEYEIHYGLANTLNTGRNLRRARPRQQLAHNISDDKPKQDSKQVIHKGRVKIYNQNKGFGFIIERGLRVDIFFRTVDLAADLGELRRGQTLQYELEQSQDGRFIAKNIVRAEDQSPSGPSDHSPPHGGPRSRSRPR
jgi:cold shock CspA family protein